MEKKEARDKFDRLWPECVERARAAIGMLLDEALVELFWHCADEEDRARSTTADVREFLIGAMAADLVPIGHPSLQERLGRIAIVAVRRAVSQLPPPAPKGPMN